MLEKKESSNQSTHLDDGTETSKSRGTLLKVDGVTVKSSKAAPVKDRETKSSEDEITEKQKQKPVLAEEEAGRKNAQNKEEPKNAQPKTPRKNRTRKKKKPVTADQGYLTEKNTEDKDSSSKLDQQQGGNDSGLAATPAAAEDDRAERNPRRKLRRKARKQGAEAAVQEETDMKSDIDSFRTNETASKTAIHSKGNKKKKMSNEAQEDLVFDYEEIERELMSNDTGPLSLDRSAPIQFAPIPVNKKRVQSRQQQQISNPVVLSSSSSDTTATTAASDGIGKNKRDLRPVKLPSRSDSTNKTFSSRKANTSKPTAKNRHAEIPPPPSLIHDSRADKRKMIHRKDGIRANKEEEEKEKFVPRTGSSSSKSRDVATSKITTEVAAEKELSTKDKSEIKKKRKSILSSGSSKEIGLPVKPVIFVKEEKKHSTVVSVKRTSQATSNEKKRENREVLRGLKDIKQVDYCHPDDIIHGSRRRRLYFDRYIDPKTYGEQVKKGVFHRGVIRINKRNRKDAYVTCDSLDADILIYSQRHRNRALDGDDVVVELLDVDTVWGKKKNAMVKRREERHSKAEDWPVMDEEEDDKSKPKYVGKVVAIAKARRPLTCVGILSLDRQFKEEEEEEEEAVEENEDTNSGSSDNEDENKQDEDIASEVNEGALTATTTTGKKAEEKQTKTARIAWFKPIDLRKPIFAVQLKYAPADIMSNLDKYKQTLMVGQITRWPIDSSCPFGAVVRELGPIGNIPAETKGILEENHIVDKPFSKKALKCLPTTPWFIGDDEINKRRDLRDTRIFTIDPATAKDLDDAVHITKLENDEYEVGVHIADVSHFVHQHTALDHEAFDRGTSTYLCDRVIPMLPSLLCEQLCSLNPGVERLAFSVIWKMDGAGHIHHTWFGKTVIKSCVKLAYDDAQSVIEDKGLPEAVSVQNHDRSQVEQDIKYLYEISKQMRQRRFENGALSINSIRLSFQLNEVGEPCDVSVYEQKDANRLIEEFMLCANMSVAEKISSHYPDEALLRQHSAPHERGLNDFIKIAEQLGYTFDASSAGSIQKSINAIDNEDVKSVLKLMLVKPMQRAKYFCTGSCGPEKYRHYALNVPLYTHFTSPIRRFADIIVHRQLEAALRGKKACGYKKHSVEKATAHCNERKEGAKNAQDMNIQLYLSHYLHLLEEKTGKPLICSAIVTQVFKDCFEILVPEYGLEKRIHMDMLPIDKFVYDSRNVSLTVYWKEGIEACREFDLKRKKDENYKEPSGTELLHDTSDIPNDEPTACKIAVKLPAETAQEDWIDKEKKSQQFELLSKLTVRIQINVERSPPIVNIYPVNPFAN